MIFRKKKKKEMQLGPEKVDFDSIRPNRVQNKIYI